MSDKAIINGSGIVMTRAVFKKHFNINELMIEVNKKCGKKVFTNYIRLYKINNDIICVPTAFVNTQNIQLIDKRPIIKQPINININPQQHQIDLIDQVIEHYTHNDSCVLVMPTGSGKSFVCAMIAKKLGLRTLIIIPNTTNLDTWKNIFGNNAVFNKIDKEVPVSVMTVHTAIKHLKFPDFSFVVYDECHSYTGEKFRDIYFRTNLKYKLGLTATPNERPDYKCIMDLHLGKQIILEDTNNITWDGIVFKVPYYGEPEFTEVKKVNDVLSFTETIKMIVADPRRKQIIVDLIVDLYNNNRDIFVFAELTDYIIDLQRELSAIGIDSNRLIAKNTSENERELAKESRITLTTYQYSSFQLSIPKKDTILFATPRKGNMDQILGRITRLGGDRTITRHIYDVVDQNTFLTHQFKKRCVVYESKKWEVREYIN